ncbi:MAG: purine biosynthesis protein PurH [Clostridium sp.]|nr:purine biosynthesis protein PurH [Clostridium sp.]
MDKFLIKNTTREQREQIVKDSLGYSDLGCDGFGDGYEMYQPYIDGEMEISEITQNYRASYVSESLGNYRNFSCMK